MRKEDEVGIENKIIGYCPCCKSVQEFMYVGIQEEGLEHECFLYKCLNLSCGSAISLERIIRCPLVDILWRQSLSRSGAS